MKITHDPIRHVKYLRQSLSQDSEPIGFFLSAGCPLSVELPQEKWPLIPDVTNLTKFINSALEGDKNYAHLIKELIAAKKDIHNIEEILSFLRALISVSTGGDVRGLNEEQLTEIEKAICKIIVSKINVQLPDHNTPYHKLAKWIRSIDRKKAVEIYTTNYDLLMEQSLEDMEIPYFDGFVGANKPFFDLRALEDNLIPEHWSRLWKIHGSINWCQQDNGIHKKVYRAHPNHNNDSHLIYPSHLKYEESRKMPYLALLDQLNRFIRRKSSFLVVSGYSFNDGHLNDVIVSALKANPTAMVLGLMFGDYIENDKEKYPQAYKLATNQHNLNIWTKDHAIIGTNFAPWRINLDNNEDDKEILNFIESFNYDDNSGCNAHVNFGDFNKFTSFLQRIIGTAKESKHG